MKTLLLAIGFAFGGILTTFAQGQVIPLTTDTNLSSISITIAGATSSSQLSGDATFELQSNTAQISDLDLVLDDGLNFSLFSVASASTSPGDATIALVTPGAAGVVSGNTFNQLANSLTLAGDLNIVDIFGFVGGTRTFDLSEIEIAPVDFNSVNITQLGNLITISNSATIIDTINLGAGDLPLEIELDFVASGIVPELLIGDVNLDGSVNGSDILPFIQLLVTGGFQNEADCNQNNSLDFLDIPSFIILLNAD